MTLFLFEISFDIADDHAFAFSLGSEIVNALVFIVHPRNVMISDSPPSACNFRSEAASGRLIGSSLPACGRNCRCRAIKTADLARST